MSTYESFIKNKITISDQSGFTVTPDQLHTSTFPHQRDAIQWAAEGGRRLIAMNFGMGKTHVATELMRLIHERERRPTLIVCPLGVKHQFIDEDGPRLGVDFRYVRDDAEVVKCQSPFMVTNYERIREGNISTDPFVAVSLDEGSVLRSLGSKTQQLFEQKFSKTPYRFVCTATPSPNNYKELIYYAQFLGIMDAGQALTRWFQRDTSQAGNLTIHPNHEKEFWMWVASWGLFLTTPSDLGYSDDGYSLPPIAVEWHRIASDHERAFSEVENTGQRRLLLDSAGSMQQDSREARASLESRIGKAVEIIAAGSVDDHWLIWHYLEDERKLIEQMIPDAVSVYGSQPDDLKEARILDFVHGKIRILAGKPQMLGAGCNFQRFCHRAIFVGPSNKFQDFIQAVHRIQRFQQSHPVEVHIIHTDAQDATVRNMKRKWQQHGKLMARMQGIIQKYGLRHEAMKTDIARGLGMNRREESGQGWTAVLTDCVEEARRLDGNSVDMICTSIPFSNHYEYSANYNDFGHNDSDDSFFGQMDYLIFELYRILKPGRVAAIHVKDLVNYSWQNGVGFATTNRFSDKTIDAFERHGFHLMAGGRITIVTDVVRENSTTYRLGWSENCKDSSKMGAGMPEYWLLLRKPPTDKSNSYADEPVTKSKDDYTRARWQLDAHSFWRSSGNRLATPDEVKIMSPSDVVRTHKLYSLNSVYNFDTHVDIGEALEDEGRLPSHFMMLNPQSYVPYAWTDANLMSTLNSKQSQKKRENHLCPLPFDLVQRVIERFSNEGELIFEPFGGLMTVPYVALELGRKAYACELNPEYWAAGVDYLQKLEHKLSTPTLFDFLQDAGVLQPVETGVAA